MGSRESSTMCSSQVIRNSSIYVFACVLIAALGYIQFGFTCDYSSPTEAAITKDLSLTGAMVVAIASGQISLMIAGWLCISFAKVSVCCFPVSLFDLILKMLDWPYIILGRLLEGFDLSGTSITGYIICTALCYVRGSMLLNIGCLTNLVVHLYIFCYENFRLLYNTKGRFRVHSIRDEEAKVRTIQFEQKGIPFINTYDGRTLVMTPLKSTWKRTRLLSSSSLLSAMLSWWLEVQIEGVISEALKLFTSETQQDMSLQQGVKLTINEEAMKSLAGQHAA
ncbi:hypothetical protein HID58_081999 [Brassica napus]|uniref:Small ribosomal subunit protein eS4 central region domain-containing protein n=1 Tax=Brassica napus TaxID=3708 RepID=A0ABQ7Y9A8_BRANA|nr:hypothetical protein HID58_081999 [Brassica napus]